MSCLRHLLQPAFVSYQCDMPKGILRNIAIIPTLRYTKTPKEQGAYKPARYYISRSLSLPSGRSIVLLLQHGYLFLQIAYQ